MDMLNVKKCSIHPKFVYIRCTDCKDFQKNLDMFNTLNKQNLENLMENCVHQMYKLPRI